MRQSQSSRCSSLSRTPSLASLTSPPGRPIAGDSIADAPAGHNPNWATNTGAVCQLTSRTVRRQMTRLRRWAQDQCLDLSSQNVEAQDEIRCRGNRGRVHGLVARLLPRILPAANRNVGSLLKREQPARSVAWTFFAFARSNHKSDRIPDGPAVSRIGNRMHAGRTRDCRRDYRPYQPLRPIGCGNQFGRPPAARGAALTCANVTPGWMRRSCPRCR
jgi:hypothetical protein